MKIVTRLAIRNDNYCNRENFYNLNFRMMFFNFKTQLEYFPGNLSLMHCKLMTYRCLEEEGNEFPPETTLSWITTHAAVKLLNFHFCDSIFNFPRQLKRMSGKSVTNSSLINDVQILIRRPRK